MVFEDKGEISAVVVAIGVVGLFGITEGCARALIWVRVWGWGTRWRWREQEVFMRVASIKLLVMSATIFAIV